MTSRIKIDSATLSTAKFGSHKSTASFKQVHRHVIVACADVLLSTCKSLTLKWTHFPRYFLLTTKWALLYVICYSDNIQLNIGLTFFPSHCDDNNVRRKHLFWANRINAVQRTKWPQNNERATNVQHTVVSRTNTLCKTVLLCSEP